MSIWGKVIGGVAGFTLGGPLGALIGVYAGHKMDQARSGDGSKLGADTQTRQVAFTMAVIVLSAKMAKADGVVTREEVEAFKRVFHIPPDEMKKVGQLFDEARKDASGYEPYAQQVAQMFRHEPAILEELIGGLFHIAKADGEVHPAELEFLAKVSVIFGFSEHDFERLRASYDTPEKSDPYEILGVSRDDDDGTIKKAYRKLIVENHPDKLMAQGLPQEFVDLANEKMAAINAAYDTVKKQRGFS
ncbi:MAG TPA: TerB family tellurite resistance protein [Rhodospirillales bacterium]|jgi:DnaJ like chaperone protein|nr:TerB family tellurite resistance protein [Rhodospirillales bacterium]|tara:strand:+ start:211 stop:948 length:738 start_codon:yes stop_codon:yes gene_type:complete